MLDKEEMTQLLGSVKKVYCNGTKGIIIFHCIKNVGVKLKAISGNEAKIEYEFIDRRILILVQSGESSRKNETKENR